MLTSHTSFRLLALTALLALASSASATPDFSALPRTESPNLKRVKPPANPKVFNEHMPDAQVEKLPIPKQPPELTDALLDLDKGSVEERVAKLKKKTIADLVYVRGGSFMRGDFAKIAGIGAALTASMDDKAVKEITLSDFWMGKYKITYAEFDVFTDATGKQRTGTERKGIGRHPLASCRCLLAGSQGLLPVAGANHRLPLRSTDRSAVGVRGAESWAVLCDGDG